MTCPKSGDDYDSMVEQSAKCKIDGKCQEYFNAITSIDININTIKADASRLKSFVNTVEERAKKYS